MTNIELIGPPEVIDRITALQERAEKAEARVAEMVSGLHQIRDFACERSFIMAMQSVVEACDVLLTAKPSTGSDRPLDSVGPLQTKKDE